MRKMWRLAISVAIVGVGLASAHAESVPAGADKTKIKDWADPRPAAWSESYPLFGAVPVGDGSLKRILDDGTLKVCAAVGSRPYSFIDTKTQETIGSDVDFSKAVAEQLGIPKFTFVNVDFASLIPTLTANRCDVIIASLLIRSDRAKAQGVRFTTPYGLIFDELVVRKDSPYKTIEDMKGQKVASLAGSTDVDTLKASVEAMGGGIDVVAFTGSNECYLAVVEKLAAGCFYDDGSAAGALAQYDAFHSLDKLYTYAPVGKYANETKSNPYVLGSVGMITHAADNDLNRALSIVLSNMASDGSQKRILEKWGMWHDGEEKMVR
jgi:ABC-type amino acid transport substrate-binding protein